MLSFEARSLRNPAEALIEINNRITQKILKQPKESHNNDDDDDDPWKTRKNIHHYLVDRQLSFDFNGLTFRVTYLHGDRWRLLRVKTKEIYFFLICGEGWIFKVWAGLMGSAKSGVNPSRTIWWTMQNKTKKQMLKPKQK